MLKLSFRLSICYSSLVSVVCLYKFRKKGLFLGGGAGVDGRCNHVTATLFAAVEYCQQRLQLQPESSTEGLSCTSQPCQWNVPRERTGNVTPIGNMTFSKHDYYKTNKKKRCYTSWS
jgi:hypothetical protein